MTGRAAAGLALDLGTPPASPNSSDEFEQVSYPTHWASHDEHLPLHYMSEDKARRRVLRGPTGGPMPPGGQQNIYDVDDDQGKDVYAKLKAARGYMVGSGRITRPPPPPPASLVSAHIPVHPPEPL
jgi:dolichyl-phosphate-mannose-protein mannosyltransferase